MSLIETQASLPAGYRGIAKQAVLGARLELAKRHIFNFTRHTFPNYRVSAHNRLLGRYLDEWVSGRIDRLMVFLPPRHGKSELVSRRLPAFILGCYWVYPQHATAYLLFFAAVLFHFSTFVAAGALFKNNSQKSIHYENTLIERAEAFIVFSLMLLMPEQMFGILMTCNVLVFFAAATRLWRVIQFEAQ